MQAIHNVDRTSECSIRACKIGPQICQVLRRLLPERALSTRTSKKISGLALVPPLSAPQFFFSETCLEYV